MALLNRFSKLNDRGETGIFTFIVTKSVTRDFHRDATTKDFCFGYHRWAISFQRPTEKVLGVHLLLRNPSPNTACVVDFTLTLLNREHFSQNEVYTKRQAKFTITNPMQGVSRWIQMSDLIDRHFSNETGEFLFELSLSNMTTIFECDIQLSPTILTQYKSMLKNGLLPNSGTGQSIVAQQQQQQLNSSPDAAHLKGDSATSRAHNTKASNTRSGANTTNSGELINLETNYFTFGAFDWSLTIVPLVTNAQTPSQQQQQHKHLHKRQPENSSTSSSASSNNNNHLLTPNKHHSSSNLSISSTSSQNGGNTANSKSVQHQKREPVCRVYLNRLNGFDCLCRVKYRVILGHHQPGGQHPAEFVDSNVLDQISDTGGRIRGHQFRSTNILKLISLRSSSSNAATSGGATPLSYQHHSKQQQQHHSVASLDLRVHIEMFCANTVSEARVPLQRKPNEAQVSNCSDRNKQAWCVESDSENENIRLKLFFMDLQSVPRNHIRYISWIAYIVRRDSKSGAMKESIAVRNAPHSNYYLQDGMDMGTLMDTDIPVKELNNSPQTYLEANQLTVHIEWVDSLLLFSHLYNNYDSLATIQRHQIRRELCALQQEFAHLEKKYVHSRRSLNKLHNSSSSSGQQQQQRSADCYSPSSPPSPISMMSSAQQITISEHPVGARNKPNSRTGSLQLNSSDTQLLLQQQQQQQQLHQQYNPSAVLQMKQLTHNMAVLTVNKSLDIQSSTSSSVQASAATATATSTQSQRQGSLRTMGLSMGDQWSSSSVASESSNQMSVALSNQPYSAHNQHKTPMSHDERLKFSSSTPPGSLAQQQQQSQGRLSISDSSQQQQQREQLNKVCNLLLSQSIRRRLPQQPGTGKLLELRQQASHQLDRRDSQTAYQQAIRDGSGSGVELGGFELARARDGSPTANATQTMFVSATMAHPTAIDSCSINDLHPSCSGQQQQSSVPESAIQDRRHTMNILMEEAVAGQQHLISQVESEQVDRYHHGVLNSINSLGQQQHHSPIPGHRVAQQQQAYSLLDDKLLMDVDGSGQARRRTHNYLFVDEDVDDDDDQGEDDDQDQDNDNNHDRHLPILLANDGHHQSHMRGLEDPAMGMNLDLEMETLYAAAGGRGGSIQVSAETFGASGGQPGELIYELRRDSAPIYANKANQLVTGGVGTGQGNHLAEAIISRGRANNFANEQPFERQEYEHYGRL